jgi:hypothetical protein
MAKPENQRQSYDLGKVQSATGSISSPVSQSDALHLRSEAVTGYALRVVAAENGLLHHLGEIEI